MVWVKKKYKSYKGFKWIWKPEIKGNMLDETCFNKPKAYCSEYAHKKGKRISSRQYKNGKSAICLVTPNGNYFTVLDKPVQNITLKDKAKFLKSLGIKKVYCDKRSLGLNKYGIEVKLISKRYNIVEKKFGYKTAIHKLPRNTPKEIVETIHLMYLKREFKLVRIQD